MINNLDTWTVESKAGCTCIWKKELWISKKEENHKFSEL